MKSSHLFISNNILTSIDSRLTDIRHYHFDHQNTSQQQQSIFQLENRFFN